MIFTLYHIGQENFTINKREQQPFEPTGDTNIQYGTKTKFSIAKSYEYFQYREMNYLLIRSLMTT